MVAVPDRVRESMYKVLDLIKSGKLPEAVAIATFPNDDLPMNKWSLFNRLNCVIASWTFYPDKKPDYRGFQMWKKAGRNVKAGQKAHTFILVPINKKFTARYYESDGVKHRLMQGQAAPEGKVEKSEQREFLWGFKGIPVFHVEQTQGKPIAYIELKLPDLPFLEVAKAMDIKVIPVGFSGEAYGSFSPQLRRIKLATDNESTFFHELAHAVDHHIMVSKGGKGLSGGQHIDQEVVAEFSAACLAYMQGIKIEQNVASSKRYIEHYVQSKEPDKEILKLFSRIEGVIEYILNHGKAMSPTVRRKEKEDVPKTHAQEMADAPEHLVIGKEAGNAQ